MNHDMVPLSTPGGGFQTPRDTLHITRIPSSSLINQQMTATFDNFHALANITRARRRKRKQTANNDDNDSEMTGEELTARREQDRANDEKLRNFDRQVRFTSFRWHSSRFYPSVIRSVYGQELKSTATLFLEAKKKLTENIATHKYQFISRLEVSYSLAIFNTAFTNIRPQTNIRTMMKDPAFANGTDDNVRDRCKEAMNSSTFEYVWYYLKDVIDYDQSQELGQYFIKGR